MGLLGRKLGVEAMSDFVQTMKDWHRMCKANSDDSGCKEDCPLLKYYPDGCHAIYEEDCTDDALSAVEETIAMWEKENPVPTYPMWMDWLKKKYKCDLIYTIMYERIPADIAKKLGIEPIKR